MSFKAHFVTHKVQL